MAYKPAAASATKPPPTAPASPPTPASRAFPSGPAGTIATFAGNGTAAFSGDGGPATSASLYLPSGVAVDSAGNLYIADQYNCRVRKVAGGIISTVAGNGACAYGGDGGPATSASLNQPYGVAVDSAGNLYIADTINCRVRKVAAGIISTVAGNGAVKSDGHCTSGGDGGPATSASLDEPTGIAVDSAGDLYIGDSCHVRKVAGGIISTIAGVGTGLPNGCGYSGDGGPATSAWLFGPEGVAVDSAGDLYIADSGNCRVRKVAGGVISTVAGKGACKYGDYGDGGPATSTSLRFPSSVAVDSAGNLYIADNLNCLVRKVAGGIISTVAGYVCAYVDAPGDGGPATSASLNLPSGVAVDSAGNLYIADSGNNRVRIVYGVGGR
ncbi:MAG: NHL repeat-containing protein [Dehalococcoidia bacterium]